jgi:hypothetical protein
VPELDPKPRKAIAWPTAAVMITALVLAGAVLLFAPPDVRQWALGVLAIVSPIVLGYLRGLFHGERP